jgi:hypothetical protein
MSQTEKRFNVLSSCVYKITLQGKKFYTKWDHKMSSRHLTRFRVFQDKYPLFY